MIERSIRIRVEDMLEAIDTARDLIEGLDFDTYDDQGFRGQRRGVERCIEIVSEASRYLPEDLRARYPDIPWRSIRDIGNILRHGYSTVDNQIIWKIADTHLPQLKIVLRKILATLPPDPDA
jgi:uncharacterized protein with HEPN domain